MNFADRLTSAVKRSGSVIAAGLDPRLEDLPLFVQEGLVAGTSLEDRLDSILSSFYLKALEKLSASVAAIKPNIAFFEQYGIGGLRAYEQVIAAARAMGLLVITDAKRGDIGSTAQAYSSAFLGKTSIAQESRSFFESDALTVNPYLGFDTLEVFINDCIKYKKGIFVLVKTSNPGSASIQDITDRKSGKSISALVADWLGENSGRLYLPCPGSGA
ncbi:MAG: orotidine-5'-phosphate decarboxylase [Proteobacteria bacterium]|nr:MAG: orotidine-5'-phosphate decarboxylase [Pseudomonadota bacterium]